MAKNLFEVNIIIKGCMTEAFKLADDCNEQGIADFLAGRIDLHDKYVWQLSTIVGADSMTITRLEY
jgi:DNA-binding ferritin-like protein